MGRGRHGVEGGEDGLGDRVLVPCMHCVVVWSALRGGLTGTGRL